MIAETAGRVRGDPQHHFDRWPIAFALLAVIAIARIVSMYWVFNQTFDEPSNLACGMEWLSKGTYSYDPKHPPLGRVAVAVLPYISGLRHTGASNPYVEGNTLLQSNGAYQRNLALARLGTLPFFVLSALVVWLWTSVLFGRPAAFAAALLYTTLPPILGNASQATTDMSIAATLPVALGGFCFWLERATVKRALLLGLALAAAVLSKFTAFVFLPGCLLVLWVMHRRRSIPSADPSASELSKRLIGLMTAAALFLLLVWAGYRFSWAPVSTIQSAHPAAEALAANPGLRMGVLNRLVTTPVPAPELIRGVYGLWRHNQDKRVSFFLGRYSLDGWWYYFPVILVLKTPIAFLILTGIGIFFLARRTAPEPQCSFAWQAAALPLCAAVILLVSLLGRVHTGLRHVLSLYPILAIIAGYGAYSMMRRVPGRRAAPYVAAVLMFWHLVSSAAAHPDYLTYFNEIAGGHPEKFVVNGELDGGQDLKRLSEILRPLRVTSLALAYYGSANPELYGLPPANSLAPYQRTSGWAAISVRKLKMGTSSESRRIEKLDAYAWLNAYQPVARAGQSILVYFVPRDP